MNAASAWLAGSTVRWHVQPQLSMTRDRVDGHSGRVAILVLQFKPDAPVELLRAAIVHDLGESQVGDLAYPVKRNHPEIAAATEILEKVALRKMGLDFPDLPEDLAQVLSYCDRLDAYLWALHHRPDMVFTHPAWLAYWEKLRGMALEFGQTWLDLQEEIIAGVHDGVF